MKKRILPLLIALASMTAVFATNVDANLDELTVPEESVETSDDEVDINDIPDIPANGFLHIEGSIKEKTNPISDEIYIALFHYDDGETQYVKLLKENTYSATVNIANGLYEVSTYKYDDRDKVIYDNSTFTMNGNDYTLNVTVEGVSESDYEDAMLTQSVVNGDTSVEVVEDITNLVSDNEETSSETVNNEEVTDESSAPTDAKEENNSLSSKFLHFVIDNLFILTLLIGSVLFLGIYKYRQNNGK